MANLPDDSISMSGAFDDFIDEQLQEFEGEDDEEGETEYEEGETVYEEEDDEEGETEYEEGETVYEEEDDDDDEGETEYEEEEEEEENAAAEYVTYIPYEYSPPHAEEEQAENAAVEDVIYIPDEYSPPHGVPLTVDVEEEGETEERRRRDWTGGRGREGELCSSSQDKRSDTQGSQWNRSEIDGLFCPICLEAWTTDGEHHVW